MPSAQKPKSSKIANWIVVGCIFGVLYILFFPQPHTHSPRGRVAVTKHEFRYIAQALNDYHRDFGEYPSPRGPQERDLILTLRMSNAGTSHTLLPFSLTTPVAYLTGLPYEQFIIPEDSYLSPAYFRISPPDSYILFSSGPDKDYDVHLEDVLTTSSDALNGHLAGLLYDPTNGTVSNGDIIRTRLGIPAFPAYRMQPKIEN